MGSYLGLVEVLFTLFGAVAFYIWQMRSLKRDVAARLERERAEAEKQDGSDNRT